MMTQNTRDLSPIPKVVGGILKDGMSTRDFIFDKKGGGLTNMGEFDRGMDESGIPMNGDQIIQRGNVNPRFVPVMMPQTGPSHEDFMILKRLVDDQKAQLAKSQSEARFEQDKVERERDMLRMQVQQAQADLEVTKIEYVKQMETERTQLKYDMQAKMFDQ